MRGLILGMLFAFPLTLLGGDKAIEGIRSGEIKFKIDYNVGIPVVKIKKDTTVVEDINYKFNSLRDELWRFRNDTLWLINDIRSLERNAEMIANGNQNYFFTSDLRNMSYKMSQWYNDIQRILYNIDQVLIMAKKDKELNKIAGDIRWSASDIENTFRDSEFETRNLSYLVERLDPKVVGYDARFLAYDISRYARDISYKSQDLYWKANDLVNKTKP